MKLIKPPPTEDELERLALDNITAKARSYELWPYVHNVQLNLVDRIFFRAKAELVTRIDELVDDGSFQPSIASSSHRKIRDVFPAVVRDAPLRSFRERKRPSLQIVYVQDYDAVLACEMDIDLANPKLDVVSFFIHLVEVLTPGKTDHRRIRRALLKDPDTRKYL
jgi:hypothetical protein